MHAGNQVDGPSRSPDIVLLAADWPERALLRAQLIEEGFEVEASDDWPAMHRALSPRWMPQVAVVDLKDLRNPEAAVGELGRILGPDRVLVLTGSGTMHGADIDRLGVRALRRPMEIGEIVRTIAAMVHRP